MTIDYSKFFSPTVLGTAATTLMTVRALPSQTLLRGARIRFTNTTAVPATVTAYAVPSAGTAGVGNAFISGQSISPNGFIDVDVPIMAVNDFIQALSSTATSINAQMISGSYFS